MATTPPLLLKLLNESGPSGFEQPIRDMISREMKKHVTSLKTDKFGNLIAHKQGKGPTVMLAAHMDEIGLLASNITPEGHIYTAAVGGIEPLTLLGERVKIKTKQGFLFGVVTTKDIHKGEEVENIPTFKDFYVDTGLDKKALTKLGVELGTYLHMDSRAITLGNDKIISGKALDDRLGCFILVELAKKLKKNTCNIYYVFTVQEEVGLYGSKTSVYSIDPDWALVIDTTTADDDDEKYTKHIGQGPCITIKDSEIIGNRCINDDFKAKAKKHKIPIQLEITDFGTTDALSIAVAKGGIPTGMISVPVRNLHTNAGIAHLDDVMNAVKIIEVILKDPPHVCLP
jgi:tetrahedral aminopeptidase